MNKVNTLISKETCLIYGLPGTVILAVSLLLSCKVAINLGGSMFVTSVSFVGCNLLLWMLYLLLFQYLPLDLMRVWLARNDTGSDEVLDTAAVTETSEPPVKTVHPPVITSEPPVNTVQPITAEEYQANCDEFKRRTQEEHRQVTDTIMDYVGRVMSPFMEKEQLDKLRAEILAWCDNPQHIPEPVTLKHQKEDRDRLKTVSFKHFIWNIAARLGFNNGYSVKVQAKFIKKLFPNELSGIEVKSLERSLTCSPDSGHVKLDRPIHTDNFIFHF